ncbi:Gfo/Idh/MocA family protein [Gloeobacter kilaueensis]|uniref:Gfo/Idh/MocA family protein n=1 Tax=Gloeobacter kilaueensis TaxID=1416614 RepID=UPI00059C5374|nr:Gfo/Idh/MocA family oxidoreductase [Gloeobacter kilaueensis]
MLHFLTPPVRTVVVGTGYAARQRATALAADPRVKITGCIGHQPESAHRFAAEFGLVSGGEELLAGADLVFVATANRDHALWVRRALLGGAHVVVEYPLALDLTEAIALAALARAHHRLLHVEHIELISGIHQALVAQLERVGPINLVRYSNLNARLPEPGRWTFSTALFGFPLVGAVSRLGRLVDLVGPIRSVFCQNRYFDLSGDNYRGCLCAAQLAFESGATGQIVYAKGSACARSETQLELTGSQGGLLHDGRQLLVFEGERTRSLEPGERRGLFARDTAIVLDYLEGRGELYVTLERSLHALAVASACEQSAVGGARVSVETFTLAPA